MLWLAVSLYLRSIAHKTTNLEIYIDNIYDNILWSWFSGSKFVTCECIILHEIASYVENCIIMMFHYEYFCLVSVMCVASWYLWLILVCVSVLFWSYILYFLGCKMIASPQLDCAPVNFNPVPMWCPFSMCVLTRLCPGRCGGNLKSVISYSISLKLPFWNYFHISQGPMS